MIKSTPPLTLNQNRVENICPSRWINGCIKLDLT